MSSRSDVRVGVIGLPGGKSSEALADAVANLTGERLLIDISEVAVDFAQGTASWGDVALNELDAVVVKKVGPHYSPDLLDRLELLRWLEGRDVRVFSPPRGMQMALDRLSGTVTLQNGGIPMPDTVVTESVDAAVATVERFGEAIFKPFYSTKARGMQLLTPGPELRDRIIAFQTSGNPLMYIQRKVEVPGRDLGVVFLGGEYVGTYARVQQGESWNTTIHDGGKYECFQPSEQVIELAHSAQALFGLTFTSVDVVETDTGPLVFEVSAFGGFSGLTSCGIDAAARYADYVIKQVSS